MNIENLFDYESLRYEKKYICSDLLKYSTKINQIKNNVKR